MMVLEGVLFAITYLNSYLNKPSFAVNKFNVEDIYKYIISFKVNKKIISELKNMVINIKNNYSETNVLSSFLLIYKK